MKWKAMCWYFDDGITSDSLVLYLIKTHESMKQSSSVWNVMLIKVHVQQNPKLRFSYISVSFSYIQAKSLINNV